jgi:hypothetical protein
MTNSLFNKDDILKIYLSIDSPPTDANKTSKMFSVKTIRASLTTPDFRIKYQLFPVFDKNMLMHKKIVAINEF